jgi:choline dehydrogenase-like flavoprotein
MYHYMKKAEHFTAPPPSVISALDISSSTSDYGTLGPVQVSFSKYVGKLSQAWNSAFRTLGVPANRHPLGGFNIGVSQQPASVNPANSTRSYSATAYLFSNYNRSNLRVQTNALVTKINWASESNVSNVRATGVTFISEGKTFSVTAKREVILSGGTVNTPQILELSGIGSKSVLSNAGIKQMVNLESVGENLQDHTYSSAVWERLGDAITLDTLRNNETFAKGQLELYHTDSSSPASILTETVPSLSYVSLSTLVGSAAAAKLISEVEAFVNASTAPYKSTLQAQISFLKHHGDSIGQMELIAVDGYFATSAAPVAGKTYSTFLAAPQHLFSRGSIHVNSSSPTAYPVINPNYYSVPFDVKIATAGTAYLRKIAGTPAFQQILGLEILPGSGANLETYTTTVGFTTEYHPVGTASMLPRNHGGVVDASLTVYGTQNVRVVDASIIPIHISAHIQGTVYGIAEKAADIILAACEASDML